MARPIKTKVEYFPHFCSHGKTMFVLEQEYGNDGYAFWFKTLEILGDTEGHFIDLNDESDLAYLCAKTRLDEEKVFQIIGLLAKLGAIDKDLAEKKIIWSDGFIENLDPIFSKRGAGKPIKPGVSAPITTGGGGFPQQKPQQNGVSAPITPQSKEKESKEKESKDYLALFNEFWKAYPKKVAKPAGEKAFKALAVTEPLLADILAGVDRWKQSEQWTKDGGQFIPNPAAFLNGRRWEDQVPTGGKPKKKSANDNYQPREYDDTVLDKFAQYAVMDEEEAV